MRRSGRALAFTLMEMLVALGVIAMLIAILLPFVSRARSAANSTVCVFNLHHIDTAFHLWGQSHAMRLPDATTWPSAVTIASNTTKILYCPVGPMQTGINPSFGTGPTLDYKPNNNSGHPTTFTMINADHYQSTTYYQKNKPAIAIIDYMRVSGNTWKAVASRIDAGQSYGGPPIDLYSGDGKIYYNIQLGVSYLFTIGTGGDVAATYGFNSQMSNFFQPTGGQVLAMDYETPQINFNASGLPDQASKLWTARHSRTKYNALLTNGSVQQMDIRKLQNTSLIYLAKP